MEFYKETCTGDICPSFDRPFGDYDPMIGEVLAACVQAISRPLSFSPPGSPSAMEMQSPIYTPNDTNWSKIAELNEEAAAMGYNHVIHFGPGAQHEAAGQVITTGITEQVAEMMLDERRNKIAESIFVPCELPILETPAVQRQQGKAMGKAKVVMTGGCEEAPGRRRRSVLCLSPSGQVTG